MEYKIVIPSYKRFNIFKNKTFKFLERNSLLEYATLFIQTDEDEEKYKEFNIPIIRSPLGLIHTLNFINDTYPLNTKLWLLHDDVTKFINLDNIEPENIPDIINGCFNSMILHNANLGGFYPTANPYFMKKAKELVTGCNFIHDPCCLIINQQINNTEELKDKADFERTVLYFKRDKIVLRFNHYAPVTSYNPKSMNGVGFRNPEREKASALLFKNTYPEYVRRINTHKNGSTSLVLKTPTIKI